MLIAQLNFEMQHPFADTIEPEMAGLDDAGVHRSDGYLVNLIAFHSIIVVVAGNVFAVVVSENIRTTGFIGLIANHFEPGVTFGLDAELLRDLAFEHVERLAFCR